MKLLVEVFFKVDIWDKTYLKFEELLGKTKATFTNQGLDRVGDSNWIKGVHLSGTPQEITEASTGVLNPMGYKSTISKEKSYVEQAEGQIKYIRDVVFVFGQTDFSESLKQISLSWDEDEKTSVALLGLSGRPLTEREEFHVTCTISVTQSLDDVQQGTIDFGASEHKYRLAPCSVGTLKDTYIGSMLGQYKGKMYSGSIPEDFLKEPSGSIDGNTANFDAYIFNSRCKVFRNNFSISAKNAETKTIVTQTLGLPSSYAVEFEPPIAKGENKELELEFRINWDRG